MESHRYFRRAVGARRGPGGTGGCPLHCAGCDLAGSGRGADSSSAWLPLACCSKRGIAWLFPLQQGEPAALDLEKLVSTVAAQKLVLETPAGKVSSLPSHALPPQAVSPPTECSHGQAAFCWPWLLLLGMSSILSGWARTGALAPAAEHHSLPCRHAGDGECRGCSCPLPAPERGELKTPLPWLEMSPRLLPRSVRKLCPARPRHTLWGWAAGAEAGARLWEGDGDVGWGALPPCPVTEAWPSSQEGSPTGAEPDALWEMPSSFSRPRSSAAMNLNRRTYDLEGETWCV